MTEQARQYDLFTGEMVDTRTAAQKQRDRARTQPQQTEMFSACEVLQFGVTGRPRLPIAEHTKLELEREDPRTEEEKERAQLHAAQENTVPLFPTAIVPYVPPETRLIVFEQPSIAPVMTSLEYRPPPPSRADLEIELITIARRIDHAEENENPMERTAQLDHLFDQQDCLIAILAELPQEIED